MRWVTYRSPLDGVARAGLLKEGEIRGVPGNWGLLEWLKSEGGLEKAAQLAMKSPIEVCPESSVVLEAPVMHPPSLRDFLSFEAHFANAIANSGRAIPPVWYEQPSFYFSNPAAVCGPTERVRISPGSNAFDYELELGAIIGKTGNDLSVAEANQHIAGYTILCDWSARDLQARESEVRLGPSKGKDSATSLGPYMVTPDELEEFRSGKGYDLNMEAFVNGVRYGGGNWSDIYWSFPEMVSHASRGTTVMAGDVFGSGTVGTGCIGELSRLHSEEEYPWLRPGDVVQLRVEKLGSITAKLDAAK